MQACCQLDAITIARMILCLFQLRGVQKRLVQDTCSMDRRVRAKLLSQMQPRNLGIYFIMNPMGKIVSVYKWPSE